ncbi:INO80 complex subunit E isoform X2 [Anopheles gambiae]|uniref:INO80 complex subunit E isoform X2 n=1 Tax=Anopheles gambiae TaxID=7165 RepID=UPI002AC9A1FA|nr:INO80 complex subunit E isoform X2 [Anopheles gambiae]XP_061513203.1 INO80 complex subunit E isoform X2 [Anopheles gambiae]
MEDNEYSAYSLQRLFHQSSEDYFREYFGLNDIVPEEQIISTTNEDNNQLNEWPPSPEVNYCTKYKELQKQLKEINKENVTFQYQLRESERKLLTVTRDRSFLLDRLLVYEPTLPSSCFTSSSESDASTDQSPAKGRTLNQRPQRKQCNHSPAMREPLVKQRKGN